LKPTSNFTRQFHETSLSSGGQSDGDGIVAFFGMP
jgi:hypothetical protein